MDSQMMTRQEKAALDEELKTMIAERPAIANRIAEAREKGDLRENADYHAAREELSLLEARIKGLEERLRNVSVVDLSDVPADMVFLGSTVKVRNAKTGDEQIFRLVGELGKSSLDPNSDIMEVSANSPLGEALIRSAVGSTVKVNAPRGEMRYEILELL